MDIPTPCTLDQARAAKDRARAALRHLPVVGVGVTRIGDGYGLKVNLTTAPPADATVPAAIDGVPLRLEVVGTIQKQPTE